MSTLFLSRGTSLSFSFMARIKEGSDGIGGVDMPDFANGTPLFMRNDRTGETLCLGRVQYSCSDQVRFAWPLDELTGHFTLFEPADWLALPRHLKPIEHIEHVELSVGAALLGTIGAIAPRAEELLRVRLPAAPANVIAAVIEFAKSLKSSPADGLLFVDGRRRTRKVHLVEEPAEAFPGDPFDLLLLTDDGC